MQKMPAAVAVFALSLLFAVAGTAGQVRSTATGSTPASVPPPQRFVYLIKVDAPITPTVAEYIIKAIDRAAKSTAEALIIELNTPGGLVDSTNHIIIRMMSSEIPTVVYVTPSGGRAASAGVFITLSANIAAM